MSQSLILVTFPEDDFGALLEADSEIVDHAVISDCLVEELVSSRILVEVRLLEQRDSSEYSMIRRVDDDRLNELLNLLEINFLSLISPARDLPVDSNEILIRRDTLMLMQEVRVVCNLHALATRKRNEFPQRNVVLKVG